MSTLEEQIDVDAPAAVTWEYLHKVENYPQFIDGVRQARPEGHNRAHLDFEEGGRVRECDARITDRGQGKVMTWQTEEADLKGAFTVRAIDDRHTQVQVRVEYDPARTRDTFGGPKGFAQSDRIQQLVRHDLERFKDLVESKR